MYSKEMCLFILFVRFSLTDKRFIVTFAQEYTRENVQVHPLGPIRPLNLNVYPDSDSLSLKTTESVFVPEHPEPLPGREALFAPIGCQTYIWSKPISDLDKELWSFTDFVRTNAWKWVGEGSSENEDYKEVERRRQMAGNIVR